MKTVIRVALTAIALWVATLVVPGIAVNTESKLEYAGTLLAVAVIFGLVNGFLKPIVKTLGCVFYIVTLGLVALVVNGLLLWFTSWVAGELKLPFNVDGFWAAFWGAIVVGVISWLLNLFVHDDKD
ncbi:MAG: phage holin family protein [Actinomadura sp.]